MITLLIKKSFGISYAIKYAPQLAEKGQGHGNSYAYFDLFDTLKERARAKPNLFFSTPAVYCVT
jgi:hypothetical protein